MGNKIQLHPVATVSTRVILQDLLIDNIVLTDGPKLAPEPIAAPKGMKNSHVKHRRKSV